MASLKYPTADQAKCERSDSIFSSVHDSNGARASISTVSAENSMMHSRDAGAMSDAPSVVCILLNWNGWEDSVSCLDALAKTDYASLSVILIDNGSTDDSVERIRRAYPEIMLIENGENLGFAAGNNVGLRYALQRNVDYVWLLNNDTEPAHDALKELVKRAESDPRVGAVGSTLRYTHDPQTIQAWGGGRVNRWMGYFFHATSPKEDSWFDYITAASVLLRRGAVQDIGLLDERFFLYWEDTDLSFRLREKGWKLAVAGEASVLHKVSASTRRNRGVIDRYSTVSGMRFLSKHSPVPWLSIPLFLCMRIGKRLLKGQFSRIKDVMIGIREYFR